MKLNWLYRFLIVFHYVRCLLTDTLKRAEVPSLTEVLDQGWPVFFIVDFSINLGRVSFYFIALSCRGTLVTLLAFLAFTSLFVLLQHKLQLLDVIFLVLALEDRAFADVVSVMLEFRSTAFELS